jgi:SNF2 family DNA or RNA helicase
MLTRKITSDGIVFSVNIDGHDIHFKEWAATDDCIYYLPLSTLVDNGQASYRKHECIVPFESVYLLDEDDCLILGIPKPYDKALRLKGNGMLNATDFSYDLEYLTHVPDGELLHVEREGNILVVNQKEYLLSRTQFELIQQIDDFNRQQEAVKSFEYNLRIFKSIKDKALECGCELDSYLQNENVVAPDSIKLELDRDEEGFTLLPSVEITEKNKFKRTFDRQRKVLGTYPIQNEQGERTRVVLTSEQRQGLEELKKRGCHYHNREELQQVVEHPTEYFNPDVFDLSELYSDRVIEIGVYKPKFYPFVCPYRSCWIAGATVETNETGTTKVTIENQAALEELLRSIEEAEKSNSLLVNYGDATLDIADARYLADIAKRQLDKPNEPVSDKEHKVLIIEENASELGFEVNERTIEIGDHYTLFADEYLKPVFTLKEHQREGVAWLQHLYKSRACGCLMADDMGLGKTLQVLYFIDWISRIKPQHRPFLIVAPISLLENWENEYNRFFDEPKMKITKLTSRNIPRQLNRTVIQRMGEQDIILTNYESLRVSQLNFCAVDYEVVILDEAQKIKSPGTMVTNAAKALKSCFKVAMTGTPVENSLLDLWCIMDFCVPGLLGNAKSFAAQYQTPLSKPDTDIVAMGNEIHQKLGVHFLRRLKKDVAKDLPRKFEVKEQYKMPKVQQETYQSVVDRRLNGLEPNMLITIQQIREVSEHPYLYDKTIANHDMVELVRDSARLIVTVRFVDEIRDKGDKVIVFAERKETQKMLQKLFYLRYHIVAKIINGDTPTASSVYAPADRLSRQASIDEFQAQEGFNIIIMSPVAAGMGLNVTAANHVIHYSRHWNPAKENQATDRAYRIGQQKDVYVYYPMAVSDSFRSFDVTLDELLSNKTTLATSTIFPTERVEVKLDELGKKLFGA